MSSIVTALKSEQIIVMLILRKKLNNVQVYKKPTFILGNREYRVSALHLYWYINSVIFIKNTMELDVIV